VFTVVGKFLDKSPRKMFKRYITLAGLGWGSLYPKFGNLAIIGIASSFRDLSSNFAKFSKLSSTQLSLLLSSDLPQSASS
jgi:hypothetical protein